MSISAGAGGGLYVKQGSITLLNDTLSGNLAQGGAGGEGGTGVRPNAGDNGANGLGGGLVLLERFQLRRRLQR
jgi:hypothetical protein